MTANQNEQNADAGASGHSLDRRVRTPDECCPVCGSDLLVSVVRIVLMRHCNGCGSEITDAAFYSSDRVDKRLRRIANKLSDTIDRLNDIAVNGYPDEES